MQTAQPHHCGKIQCGGPRRRGRGSRGPLPPLQPAGHPLTLQMSRDAGVFSTALVRAAGPVRVLPARTVQRRTVTPPCHGSGTMARHPGLPQCSRGPVI